MTEQVTPKKRKDLKGHKSHINEEIRSDSNQKNALAINIIILTGSFEIVKINIAKAGPKATEAQPKNSM